jgi:uncharacterized phiE125 gp8 family phage protein
MALIRITTPPLAVSIEDARSHLLLDDQTDRDLDEKLKRALQTAHENCAKMTSRALAVALYEKRLPCWPMPLAIEVPIAPVREVSSIKYRDSDGNAATVDPADYQIEITDRTSWVTFRSDYSQPALSPSYPWPLVVTVSAGFDAPDTEYASEGERDIYKLPPALRDAVLMMTEKIFEAGAIADDSYDRLESTVMNLLGLEQIYRK